MIRSEEHTSELQSLTNLVCRLLLDTATTEIYTLSLHDALPISGFRWTAKEAEFFLKKTEASQNIKLRARSDHPGVSTGSIAIALEINGRELKPERLKDHSWHDQIGRAHV